MASATPPFLLMLAGPTQARAAALREVGESVPLPIEVTAMLDTGSEFSVIAPWIAAELALDPSGERSVIGLGAAAPKAGLVYQIRLMHPGIPPVPLASDARVVAVENMEAFGVAMILGRDLLSRCVVIYNGPEGRCTFAF